MERPERHIVVRRRTCRHLASLNRLRNCRNLLQTVDFYDFGKRRHLHCLHAQFRSDANVLAVDEESLNDR